MKETVVSQKSFISSQEELSVTFLLQKVCLGVICENKKVEGTLLTEKVREVFGGVRGARIHNHNKVRGCGCLAECYGTNPIFSSFSWHFWTGTSWYTFTIGVRVRA